ncbi:23S rRNA (guanosine(2251)-2'-O)-methyltransferase RlmB [Agrococcus casei]|uniref:23S rRNA (Guanosine-2'-O-)-methyltransferase rlmB n=1 Tax=Agrococcus casei LMG 22410 TaxID=1255656 RepID=A0A1R4GCS0_9MICO|nr:23S rRNA (guanosine(2251)-2'-O)-methyltransferase RlmB [Agrococcus casei]SJM66000.1 23S rRNA (guanosine-2'-O-)-methyltransferase rlmB [Agrococcus casei LMG 22410]
MNRPSRPAGKKGPQKGTGGKGRRSLEGRGPTPKAEDREYHPAAKRKAARERYDAAAARHGGGQKPQQHRRRPTAGDDSELVTGRNSVLEALRTKVPATALYIANRIEVDDRVKEIMRIATGRGVPIMEVMRPELDRLTGADSVHQGLALKVPPYQYSHPSDLLDRAARAGEAPLIVALDGVTDPRNLGAIVRSAAAFGAHGVVIPQRRSAGMTASAWKTSAGAAARLPVALASNLNNALKDLKADGLFIAGLDAGGDVDLPSLNLAKEPLVIVVGSEGEGLSRLAREICDVIVSIPIGADTESLNAGIAASVSLYEISKQRAVRA